MSSGEAVGGGSEDQVQQDLSEGGEGKRWDKDTDWEFGDESKKAQLTYFYKDSRGDELSAHEKEISPRSIMQKISGKPANQLGLGFLDIISEAGDIPMSGLPAQPVGQSSGGGWYYIGDKSYSARDERGRYGYYSAYSNYGDWLGSLFPHLPPARQRTMERAEAALAGRGESHRRQSVADRRAGEAPRRNANPMAE